MSDSSFWFADPQIQAALDEVRKNPPRMIPEPEAISFGFLGFLLDLTKGPCPNVQDDPDAHAIWCHTWSIIRRVPGIRDLERYANSELLENLSPEVMNRLCKLAAGSLGLLFEEVDRLLVREVVAALPNNKHQSVNPTLLDVSPVICSQAAIARFFVRDENTTGLLEKLKLEGFVKHFDPPERRGGKYKVWITDSNDHERALKEISGKPPRRRRQSRKRRVP